MRVFGPLAPAPGGAAAVGKHPFSADRRAANVAYNKATFFKSNDIAPKAEHGRKAACQAPKYRGHSDRAADAVRGRSFAPRPTQDRIAWCSWRARLMACRLTPARWSTKEIAGHFWRATGSGGTVPSGTALEPRWNFQQTDIAALFARFQRFHAMASRDVRAGMGGRTCAYMRDDFDGTLEPCLNNVNIHLVSGSNAVPVRFHLEPAGLVMAGNGRILRFRHILVAVWAAADRGAVVSTAIRALEEGQAGATFGDFGLGAGGGRPGASWSTRRARNGGILGFRSGRSGLVGRVMLEGLAQWTETSAYSCPRRQPSRLGRGGPGWLAWGGLDRAKAPPVPPFAPGSGSSTLADAIFSIRNGDRRIEPVQGGSAQRAGARQNRSGNLGSGLGWCWIRAAKLAASLGGDRAAGEALRQSGHASGRVRHVN